MHFSVSSTSTFSSYIGYNIYINGSFHCCLRYKQLHSLHEQLKRSLPNLILPAFPPKKFLALTQNEIEQRRIALERYLQLVGQDSVLSKSNLLRSFLLNAQQESSYTDSYETNLDVFLMNGYKISVNINTTECSVKVLEKALKAIDVLEEHYYYFSLFLIRKEQDGGVTLVRKLMDFESPFISHKLASECKIVIRKSYWDAAYDLELIKHKISLNLLYIQTLNDIERGWIIATKGIKEDLTTLQATGRKHSYMLMVRELPSYGCLQFSNVNSDYPDDNTQATVIVGCKELGIRTSVGKKIQETKFKVTRMRCWRVTTIVDSDKLKSKNPPEDASANSNTYELSFEYLMAKNCLKWIKLTTCSAMIISVCLQNMVDELLNQKNGQDVNNIQTTPNSVAQLDYIRRENVNTKLQESSSDSSISNLSETKTVPESSSLHKKLKQKISTSVLFRNGKEAVHNQAFEEIGDEDL